MRGTPRWFKEGLPVTCEIHDIKINDAKLHLIEDCWYICHNNYMAGWSSNMLNYKYAWNIGLGDDLENDDVSNLEPFPLKEMLIQIKKEIAKC